MQPCPKCGQKGTDITIPPCSLCGVRAPAVAVVAPQRSLLHSSQRSKGMTRALLVLAGVLLASSVHAQTVISVSPTNGILFTASADQNTTELDGSARLTRYE